MDELDSYVNQFVSVSIHCNEYIICQLGDVFLQFSEERGYYFLVSTTKGWGYIRIYPQHVVDIKERTYNALPSIVVNFGVSNE